MKLTDKAIRKDGSESSGRNFGELKVASSEFKYRRPSPFHGGEGSMTCPRLTTEARRSGGVVETAR